MQTQFKALSEVPAHPFLRHDKLYPTVSVAFYTFPILRIVELNGMKRKSAKEY